MNDLVVVAGSRSLVLDLLVTVLKGRGMRVARAVPTPEALAAAVRHDPPALCLVDHHDAAAAVPVSLIASAAGSTRVVLLSAQSEQAAVRAALQAGAAGFVHTALGVEILLEAIEDVRAGREVVRLPVRAGPGAATDRRPTVGLTRRERECLELLVEGTGTPGIARALTISELTVRSHVQSILHKLGAHSRLEAASLAIRHGLLDVDEGRRIV